MKYTLEELREYVGLLREIERLEGDSSSKPVPSSYWTEERREEARIHGRKAWTEERRAEQSRKMMGNTISNKTLDAALAPMPANATQWKSKNYHCSICNGIGHNSATCTVLVEDFE